MGGKTPKGLDLIMNAKRLIRILQRKWALEGASTLLLLCLRIFAIGLPLLILYVWADALLALPEATRRVWNLLLPALVIGLSLIGLRPPGRLSDLALRLDRCRKDRRRTISCALDLCEDAGASPPLHQSMRRAALSDGETALKATPVHALVPFRALGLALLVGIAAAFIARGLARAHPEATDIVLARLRNPSADIAPWTRLQFEFLPENPTVVYGEDIQLGVRIHNGLPEHPVQLRTRIAGIERDAGCFREREDTFSQRIEQVTQPVEYCFTVGRIRSEWRRVELQVLPRVTAARVSLAPPEYSGFPSRSFSFGEQGIEALRGAAVTLEVQSNRPLSGGELSLVGPETTSRIRATLNDEGHAVFKWKLEEDAELAVQLNDIQGNRMARPLSGVQRVRTDQRPVAVITEPPRFALATPETRLPLKGYASDDIGVTRLSLVRGMPGFIDRATVLWEGTPQRRRDFTDELPLDAIGVEPGQTLELYLETRDYRPDSPETGVSEMVRIQIITTEEYALQLRNREKLDGFRRRFAISSAILTEVAEAYRELHEILQGNPSIEEVDAALAATAEVMRRAAEVFEALEEDFPIYDLESAAAESLANLRGHFQEQASELQAMSHRDMDLDQKVERMAAAFLDRRDQHREHEDFAEQFIKVGELLEQTTAFQRLIQRQEALEREFARHAYSLPPEERDRLRRLERQQRALREELREWIETTRQRADALPNEFEGLRDQVHEMLQGLQEAEAEAFMEAAANAAGNEANRQAWQMARAALEALRNPPGDQQEGGDGDGDGDNDFGRMCRGQGGSGGLGNAPGIGNSLDQLLNALRNAMGSGSGAQPGGSGGGPGGFSDDGYAVRGSSTLDIPMLGPNRHNFDLPRGQDVEGYALGQGRGGARRVDQRHGPSPQPTGEEALSADDIRIRQSPERYREAIRAFFDLSTE